MTMTDIPQDASDRLNGDVRDLDAIARRVMDSITGAWECEGRPFVPEMCNAAQTIVEACGRLGVALEKAATQIAFRAPDCYIDRLGSKTDATEQIQEIAEGLLEVGTALKEFPERAYKRTSRLGSIGERDD